VIRLNNGQDRFLIAEMKGADWGGLADIKAQAAHRFGQQLDTLTG
jgi:hypothetical protein